VYGFSCLEYDDRLMASFEQMTGVMVSLGVVVTCFFLAISPMNTVSGYNNDPSFSSSSFGAVVSSSNSSSNVLNDTLSSMSNIQKQNPDWTVIFSLLSLIAKSMLATLQLALGLPFFLVQMGFAIIAPIQNFIDVSPLLPEMFLTFAAPAVYIVLRFFGIVGK
jgi:hypothetical protein